MGPDFGVVRAVVVAAAVVVHVTARRAFVVLARARLGSSGAERAEKQDSEESVHFPRTPKSVT